MGVEIIDFRDKQNKHTYEQMLQDFRLFRYSSVAKIKKKCLELWVSEEKEGLHEVSEFYKYFEDANDFVEFYISKLNEEDKSYEEKLKMLSNLLSHYDAYIKKIEDGETLLFAEMLRDFSEKNE
ncbi:hypothetical protein IEO70_16395 [Bacillus sp. AGMB 02131]|uniref:Uncharacterized protein n=1 Tax=Peribacillus faecalis TaxID=2772559 RepID=A0A927D1R8_9BACI|nr:hypothetical protein [Peribacillus faecalis]MBD3109920.1 hypothetical protein [Peribacillus faecalis]